MNASRQGNLADKSRTEQQRRQQRWRRRQWWRRQKRPRYRTVGEEETDRDADGQANGVVEDQEPDNLPANDDSLFISTDAIAAGAACS